MGTRADFYVGRGRDAEWLGSIAWDGYPDGLPNPLRKAKTVAKYRKEVAKMLASRDDGTTPEMGWPWPWNDSNTSDYAYAFDEGKVWGWGNEWFDAAKNEPDSDNGGRVDWDFPDMSAWKKVTLGSRSGIMLFGVRE